MSRGDSLPLVLGLELNSVPDLRAALDAAIDESYDFVITPLVHPRFQRGESTRLEGDRLTAVTEVHPWTRSDVLLSSSEWSSSVVGRLSGWIEEQLYSIQSSSEHKKSASAAFKQEVGWAGHVGMPAVILSLPSTQSAVVPISHLLSSALNPNSRTQFWVQTPLVHRRVLIRSFQADADVADHILSKDDDTWEIWNKLRLMCSHNPKLMLCLELTEDLPSAEELNRWLGEQVRSVIVPTRIFQSGGPRGTPKLPAVHEQFLFKLFHMRGVQYVLSGNSLLEGGSMAPYHFALLQLHRAAPKLTQQQMYEQSYWDVLQMPLQPLMDNLESSTYETFEYDQAKYLVYEEAIFRALQDKLAALGTEQEGWEPVVMIVGAGRGGIVEAAMRAEERIGKKVRLYALDKNPHALVTMRTKQQFDGRWAQVHIVHSDMRAWQAPELCDILVSEMLGSFGDNELSPECLHGAERFMKPDGVSIPKWYKAYLAPLTSPRLYNAVAAIGQTSAWESPYVVRLHNVHVLSAEPQECWTFEHPEPQNRANCERQRAAAAAGGGSGWIPPAALDPIDNSRHCSLKFRIPVSALVHGFGGYFDCCLYGDVHVSIHPQNHTPNMSSWFEIFFPLTDPIYVAADQDIELDVWRVCSPVKVWYEWAVSNPSPSPIHNPNGRSYWVGL